MSHAHRQKDPQGGVPACNPGGLSVCVYGESRTVQNCEAILNMCMAQYQCGPRGACQHATLVVFLSVYTAKAGVMGEKAVKKASCLQRTAFGAAAARYHGQKGSEKSKLFAAYCLWSRSGEVSRSKRQ